MIVASMCTIPVRKQSFKQVVQRILHEQTRQIDTLHVWLNGYQAIDDDLPRDSQIVYHVEPSNPGPWVRYRVADWLSGEDELITLDDDLVYPEDYIEHGLAALHTNGANKAITFGGLRWDCLIAKFTYSDSRQHYAFDQCLSDYRNVALLMGGVTFYYADYLKSVASFADPLFSTNDDMMVSLFIHRRGIRAVCCPKAKGWISEQDTARAPHALFRRDRSTRHKTFTKMVERLGFDPTAGVLSEVLHIPRRILVFAETCPPFLGTEALDAYMRSLCADDVSVHLIAPVPISLAGQVQTYVDTPYYIHAVSVPELGGRLDWLAPVKVWRDLRVRRTALRTLRARSIAALKKLRPSEVSYWPKSQPPSWLSQRMWSKPIPQLLAKEL